AIVFHPAYNGTSNQTMFFGNDGGIFKTTNATAARGSLSCSSTNSSVVFTDLNNGYGVTQFYYGAVYPADDTYFGGAQDNGTVRGSDGGPNAWSQISGGDGGAVAVDPTNTQHLFAEYTRLSIQKSVDGGTTFNNAVTGITGDNGFQFIAPFVMDPSQSQR